MPEAAVIIPHYNDVQRLLRCLDALMPMVGAVNARALRVEVVVVDNASTDSLAAVRAAHPDLRITYEPTPGAAAARNSGVAVTTAPRLFFLDADCVPDPDWLAVALRVASDADVVGGTVCVFDETPPPRSGAEAFETVFAFNNRGYIHKKGFSVTANLLTRRNVFATVGEFVPGLSEDLDWCHRARAAGFGLVHAEGLRVSHPTRSDWPALIRKWRRITDESYALETGGNLARLKWALRGLAMILSILAHTPRVLTSSRLSGTGERLAALATLARLRLWRGGRMLGQAMRKG